MSHIHQGLHIVLYQPKIPPNTGNIIRFCANTGLLLHLVHPLGFTWDDKQLKRAGLDYQEFANINHYDHWADFLSHHKEKRKFLITTKGKQSTHQISYELNDMLIFGSEDAGIADTHMDDINEDHWLRVPMREGSRSMNLANTVALVGYEALRQIGLPALH